MQYPWHAEIYVPDGGHEWIASTGPRPTGGNLADIEYAPPEDPILARVGAWRAYNPFEDATGLFLDLAAVDPDSLNAVAAFADRFGSLSDDSPVSFTQWATMIRDLRDAVALWRAIQDEDADAIATHRWTTEGWRAYSVATGNEVVHQVENSADLSPADLVAAARNSLDRYLDLQLESGITARPYRQPEGGRQMRFQVATLRDVVWVQLTLAVDEAKSYGRCAECGMHFELTPSVNRADRTFCSDTCRQRDYRARKLKARAMAAGGATVEQIAAELRSTTETIEKWITSKRGR